MCGAFGGASRLPEGGRVKAVVSRRGDVLIAHALLCEHLGFVWIKHAWGLRAERNANFKLAWWLFLFAVTCVVIAEFFMGRPKSLQGHLESVIWMAVAGAGLCFGVALWANSDMKSLAGPATEIFQMLGFADPEKINLNSYRYGVVRIHELVQSSEMEHTHHDVYFYKKAIADNKLKIAA